jgi:hypothetical protein
MVLGIRFRFIVLFPVVIVGTLVLVAISLMAEQTAGRTLLSVVVFGGLTQLGYVCTSLLGTFIFRGEEQPEHEAPARSDRSQWKRIVAPRSSA